MPISRRPVESKRRATRLWKDLDDIFPQPPRLLFVPSWFRRKPGRHFIAGGVLYTGIYGTVDGLLLSVPTPKANVFKQQQLRHKQRRTAAAVKDGCYYLSQHAKKEWLAMDVRDAKGLPTHRFCPPIGGASHIVLRVVPNERKKSRFVMFCSSER